MDGVSLDGQLQPESAGVGDGNVSVASKNFKAAFKYFKGPKPPVLDALNGTDVRLADPRDFSSGSDKIWKTWSSEDIRPGNAEVPAKLGLKPCDEWRVRELIDSPGSLVIPNPFTECGQARWIRQCLLDFPRQPEQVSNLDRDWNHHSTRAEIDWFGDPQPTHPSKSVQNETSRKRKGQTVSHPKRKKQRLGDLTSCPIWKLRWITLGYHHDWDTKVYSEDKHTPFPQDVGSLCRCMADALGYSGFNAEAAIINYYHLDSTLSPHQDVSEPYKDAPLFSISFGQPCIFLIGPSKDKWPNAVLLRSGDVLVMSGESRLDFHGVPKIFYDPDFRISCDGSDESVDGRIRDYLKSSRINMNIRQVLKPGSRSLFSS